MEKKTLSVLTRYIAAILLGDTEGLQNAFISTGICMKLQIVSGAHLSDCIQYTMCSLIPVSRGHCQAAIL